MAPSLLSSLIAAAFAIVPLNDSQRSRLDDATDRTPRWDDAALSALLENAASELHIPSADFDALQHDPQQFRGQPFILRGSLQTLWDIPADLDHTQWPSIRAFSLLDDAGHPFILFLTHPPDLTPMPVPPDLVGKSITPIRERGSRIQCVARFYKLLSQPDLAGSTEVYPVFVGRDLTFVSPAQPDSLLSPATRDRLRIVIPIVIAVGLILLYFIVRMLCLCRRRLPRLTQWQNEQAPNTPFHDATPESFDLPNDPAAALETLHKNRSNNEVSP